MKDHSRILKYGIQVLQARMKCSHRVPFVSAFLLKNLKNVYQNDYGFKICIYIFFVLFLFIKNLNLNIVLKNYSYYY